MHPEGLMNWMTQNIKWFQIIDLASIMYCSTRFLDHQSRIQTVNNLKENKRIIGIETNYQTRHPYSSAFNSTFWCWLWYKSKKYQAFSKDVEQLKMDTSIEKIIASINTLKSQVKQLIDTNRKFSYTSHRF